jgi:hypothetical protein
MLSTSACLPACTGMCASHATECVTDALLAEHATDISELLHCSMWHGLQLQQQAVHGCKSLPACHRTLAASYMTTKLKASDTANSELPRPSLCPTAVVTACQIGNMDDWLTVLLTPLIPEYVCKSACLAHAGRNGTRHQGRTMTSAECDDGMPPESTIAVMSQMPSFIRFVKIYISEHNAVNAPDDGSASLQTSSGHRPYLTELRSEPCPETDDEYIVS